MKGLRSVIFCDNVDQLSPSYQAQIFLLTQRVTRVVGSITLIALREESYYTASVQKAFTAYSSRKFHIASPLFRKMIGSRIGYAIRVLQNESGVPATSGNWKSISDFFTIVHQSVFGKNRNIVRFIEALCYGNMRLALNMFTTFLTSGATDVERCSQSMSGMASTTLRSTNSAKSIMLGDKMGLTRRTRVRSLISST